MKTLRLLTALLLVAPAIESYAAYQPFPVHTHYFYVDENGVSSTPQTENYGFTVQVIDESENIKSEESRNGKPFIAAQPGENYSVRLYNPLPIRVAVNLTVDGLNSISGKPSDIASGEKWIIDPYNFVTIRGWQVNGGEARRFFFTKKRKSYAKWQGKQLDKDLAANCGVIGAAFFWSQRELDQYHQDHPIYRYTRYNPPCDISNGATFGGARHAATLPASREKTFNNGAVDELAYKKEAAASSPGELQQSAGTGMGERESHPTTRVWTFPMTQGCIT